MRNETGIPKRYERATLSDFPQRLQDRILPSIESGPGYTLFGRNGTGKTHAAVAILRWWIGSRRAARIVGDRWEKDHAVPAYQVSAKFIAVPAWLFDLRAQIGKESSSLRDLLERTINCRGLVIDDLGAEKQTDWTGEATYNLISQRINRCLPTVVTTNLSVQEVHDRLDPRMASRLAGLAVIEITGKDRRLEVTR